MMKNFRNEFQKLSLLSLVVTSLAVAAPPKAIPVAEQVAPLDDAGNAALLKKIFTNMNNYRGPLGLNITQGTKGRTSIYDTAGTRLFQGTFRNNETGRPLARLDFYIGNLFPSNYYELQEEYVFGIAANENHDEHEYYAKPRVPDLAALIKNGERAIERASLMAQHWNMERYYIAEFPKSKLALAFQRWGAGDSGDETNFAYQFFNFYLSAQTSDLQYLPAFMLVKESPVGDSANSSALQKARDLVADYPHDRDSLLGRIRNAVHNQLSPNIIDMIDEYGRQNGGIPSNLRRVRDILVNFYSYDPSKIGLMAKKLGEVEIQNTANSLANDQKAKKASAIGTLLELSKYGADLKSRIGDNAKVTTEKKTDALVLLTYIAQYLNSKLTNDKVYASADLATAEAIQTALNVVYIEGLLIQKNWQRFSQTPNLVTLENANKIGNDTFIKVYKTTLEQWKSLEPKMEQFIDDSVKSSALNTAAIMVSRIKEGK